MPLKLDSALGLHEQALNLRARRMEVLGSNLANADTPGYKAQDLDFKAVLQDYGQRTEGGPNGPGQLQVTNERHLSGNEGANGELLFRTPHSPSLDGNTVDPNMEKSKFTENALQYQASLQFIDGTIRTLRSAIRGE